MTSNLKLLHTPSSIGLFSIVFIHGLNGSEKTWMHNPHNSDTSWPLWVGEDSQCDTWVLTYDAAFSAWDDDAMPLPHQGASILDILGSEPKLRERQLILVGHSMGGLVIKTAIVHAMTFGNKRFQQIAEQVYGVVFIATPHQGADLANLAVAAKLLTRTNAQVADLQRHNAHLQTLNRQFLPLTEKLNLKARIFSEGKGVPIGWKIFKKFLGGKVKVVSSESADPHFPGEIPIHINSSDHFTICKPEKRHGAQIHKSLLQFIVSCGESCAEKSLPVGMPSLNLVQVSTMIPDAENFSTIISSGPPGQLIGARDRRLASREKRFLGRKKEVDKIVSFLKSDENSAVICAQVTGCGGIGKTEVCKAALRLWLDQYPQRKVYFVELSDEMSVAELIEIFGQALGADGINKFGQLAPFLLPGLYYLDNLEGIATDPDGVVFLRKLQKIEGVRLLASSRFDLAGVFGRPIQIDVLEEDVAQELFRTLWAGGELANEDEVSQFVTKDLGSHALSIALTARLGHSYSFEELTKRWGSVGAALAGDQGSDSRLDSLQVSLGLTRDAIAGQPGALTLWTVASLFSSGMSETLLGQFEDACGLSDGARQILSLHHIWKLRGDRFHVLPPVARFALDEAQGEAHGFSWLRVRKEVYMLLKNIATIMRLNKGAKEGSDSKLILLNSFDAIHKMVMQDLNSGNPDLVALEGLYRQIEGLFGHRPLQSIEMLTVSWSKMKRKSSLLSKLGDLESRIGNFEKGRQDQIQALSMFESEGDRSGQAKALTLLGDVDQRTASVVVARENFEKALLLYTDAKKPIGAANVMIRLARLELRLGHFDTAIAKYENAKQLFEKNGARIGQANALRGIADIYRRKKPINEASKFYQEALDLYKAEHDSLGQANTYKSLADIEVQAGNIEIARTMYGQALTLCEDVHNRVGAANVWRALGDLDAELDAILARSNYDQAMLLYQATGDRLGQANTFASLGYLLQRTGEHEEAIKKYVFAIQRYVTSRTPEPQVKTLLALADSHNALLQIDERDQTLIDALICISDNRLPRLFSLFMQSLIRICGDKEAVEIWLAEHDFAFSTELSITDAI